MKVSEVNIVPVKPSDGLIAFASIVVDDCLYLGSIGVHSRHDGSLRITYPTKKVGGKELNLYHPINRDTGKFIEQTIIKKCDETFERNNENGRHNQARN